MQKAVVVKPDGKGRWQIVDAHNGQVLDNAQGFGYKTKESAGRAAYWHFGGEEKPPQITLPPDQDNVQARMALDILRVQYRTLGEVLEALDGLEETLPALTTVLREARGYLFAARDTLRRYRK